MVFTLLVIECDTKPVVNLEHIPGSRRLGAVMNGKLEIAGEGKLQLLVHLNIMGFQSEHATMMIRLLSRLLDSRKSKGQLLGKFGSVGLLVEE